MFVPQKIQYALRALFELAKAYDKDSRTLLKISDIAKAQAIPHKFLETLLNTLKKGEFVVSTRGAKGGYRLAKPPSDISVALLMEYMQGPIDPVDCLKDGVNINCPLEKDCIFMPMWKEARDAVYKVYSQTSLQDFVDRYKAKPKSKLMTLSS